MFTGIVETTGRITGTRVTPDGRQLRIDAGAAADGARPGASLSVSGVCLTVVSAGGTELTFDVIAETLHRSTLGHKRVGDRVNLERSLRVGDRIDGHFVQGHVDGTAAVKRVQSSVREHAVWLQPDSSLLPYVIPKGSIAVDGVSLTIAELSDDLFSVALIPTTLERTTLGILRVGDRVNIETDLVVRAIVHHLPDLQAAGGRNPAASSGLTWDTLREAGIP